MIEICTVKRMSIIIISLTTITMFVVIYEKYLSDTETKVEIMMVQNKTEDKCWLLEEYKIKEECKPCTQFEKNVYPTLCSTGFKEQVSCTHHGDNWRSCDRVPWLERRNFWLFEGITFCIGFVAGLVTFARKKQNDHRMFERIQKQIAAGV